MYLTTQQLDRQLKALESLAKSHSAETDFVLMTDNQKVINAYWKVAEPIKQIRP